MHIIHFFIIALVVLVAILCVFAILQILKHRKYSFELKPPQKSIISFVLKLHGVTREERERFIELIDRNVLKRLDRCEHIVISKKMYKIGFSTLKKERDIEFIDRIEKKLFFRKIGF